MGEPPSGTVTFLFADIEGSTRLWDDHPDAMVDALSNHDALLRDAVESNGGYVVKTTGDGLFAAFGRAEGAITAALEAQRSLARATWGATGPLRVRMGLHTGDAEFDNGDYHGPAVNRAARLTSAGHGGQVLVSEATATLVRERLLDATDLASLGEHRLRDLARPLRLYQLCHPSLERSFPPLRTLDASPSNLPAQVTAFIGRGPEKALTKAAIAECRLVTLTGVGGVGKTRLAIEVAADVLTEYADGVWLVELGGLTDANAVSEAVASTLGAAQQPGETLVDTVLSYLRNKRLLLVLDNCEHLLGGVASLVESILATAPRLVVLTTSREPLALAGERILAVPSLPVPDVASGDGLPAGDAVELFVERARASRGDFRLTADNAEAIAHLCRRLDGIPLAIELAAARVRSMAPADIASRLDQRFRLLTGGSRSATSRHQTLRRAIDWSYELLDESERELLGRLSLCVGGFDLAAAEAIGGGGTIDTFDVDDVLGRLVDKSLLAAEEHGPSTRYRMLETIRAYVFERLDAETVEAVRRRHADHYAAFAVEAGAGLKGPAERSWLERVEDELDNLRAVVTWSLESDDPGPAMSIVAALALNGIRIESVVAAWAASAVSSKTARGDPRYPVALAFHAWMTQREGHTDEAARLTHEAEELLDAGPRDPVVVCRVLASTAGVAGSIGRSPLERAKQWLAAARLAGDRYDEAEALNMLAVGQTMAGEDGGPAASEALDVARALGNPSAVAYCAFTAASALAEIDPSRAAGLLDENARQAEAAANDYAALVGGAIKSSLLSRAGHHEAAAEAFLDTATRAFSYGHRTQQAINLWCLAGSLAVLGRPQPAAVLFGWSCSMLGIDEPESAEASGLFTNINSPPEARAALALLPDAVGPDHYASLVATGAAMSDDDALRYAQAQIEQAARFGEAPEPYPAEDNEFRRDGDVWVLGYGGTSCQLRDAKGLQYLSALLAQPGIEVHVLDLVGSGLESGSSGEVLDSTAKAAYSRRIAELEAEEAEATEWADSERAARAREEIDALTEQLASAYGLGGRSRRGPDPTERARKAVTNRISDSLKRIEDAHSPLGRHLRNAVRTGTFCSYQPERPTVWNS